MRYFIGIYLAVCLFSCTSPDKHDAHNADETKVLNDFTSYAATVVTFLGPECPLSENYTKTLNNLQKQFEPNKVRFVDVFSGTYYSEHAIDSFITLFDVQQPKYLDKDQTLTKKLQATITPECFIFDSNGKVVYSGAIDNWAVDLGQKRQVITEFYARDVLQALIEKKSIPYSKTQAVGCFIEQSEHAHH